VITPVKPARNNEANCETPLNILLKKRRCSATPEFIRELHDRNFKCRVQCSTCEEELHEGNVLDHVNNSGHEVCCLCHSLSPKATQADIGSFLSHLHTHHKIIYE
jgi:hypothetical protein